MEPLPAQTCACVLPPKVRHFTLAATAIKCARVLWRGSCDAALLCVLQSKQCNKTASGEVKCGSGDICIQGWYEHIAHGLRLRSRYLMAGALAACVHGRQTKLTGAAANPETCTQTLITLKP